MKKPSYIAQKIAMVSSVFLADVGVGAVANKIRGIDHIQQSPVATQVAEWMSEFGTAEAGQKSKVNQAAKVLEDKARRLEDQIKSINKNDQAQIDHLQSLADEARELAGNIRSKKIPLKSLGFAENGLLARLGIYGIFAGIISGALTSSQCVEGKVLTGGVETGKTCPQ